jgi:hypothetical protein
MATHVGSQADSQPEPPGNARTRSTRLMILFEMCRFVLKDHLSAPSLTVHQAETLLLGKNFRRWIANTRCLEIYNKLYIGDVDISSLYQKLDEFLSRTANIVVQHIYATTDIKPIIFKGVQIVREYAQYPIGASADLDLVVSQPFFRRACEALRGQNWVQGSYRANIGIVPVESQVVQNFEEGHYETLPFRRVFELAVSEEELARIKQYPNGTFFNVVELRDRAIEFLFEVDMHWGYLTNLSSEPFKLKESSFRPAVTLDDSDHLYIMLLRNYYEAVKDVGKLKNLIAAILLIENASVDCDRIYDRASKDNRQPAIAANISLLRKIAPHLASIVDPRERFLPYMPSQNDMEAFRDSLIGLTNR